MKYQPTLSIKCIRLFDFIWGGMFVNSGRYLDWTIYSASRSMNLLIVWKKPMTLSTISGLRHLSI